MMYVANSGFRVHVRQFFKHIPAAFGRPGLFFEGVCGLLGLGWFAQLFFTPTQRDGGFRHEKYFFDAILSERFLTSENEVFPLVSVSNRCSDLGLRMMSEGQAQKGRSYHPLPSHDSQDPSRLCSVFCSEQRGLCRGRGPPNRICMRRPKGSQLWHGRSLLRSLFRSTCRTSHAQCSRPIEERKTGMRARRSKD